MPKIFPVKYQHNRKGIIAVARTSPEVRQLIAEKTAQIEGLAQAMGAEDARGDGDYGRNRARGYVSRWPRNEARDGILQIALRQARTS